jgi:uncharacterized membrane protein YdjX (TVP38/TMEM64 family)
MRASLNPRLKWTLIICFLAGLFVLFVYQYNSQLWTQIVKFYEVLHHRPQLKRIIASYGPYSPLAYIFVQVLQVVIAPIPGGAIEFIGGYLFGAKVGFLYSMIGLFLGSWIAFSLARIFEKLAVEKFVSLETRKKFDYLIGHEGVIPKDALCYILGLTPMRLGIFLFISTVGRVPGTLMACLQGGKAFDYQYKTFLILLGISTLVLLVFYIYREEIHHMIKKLKG